MNTTNEKIESCITFIDPISGRVTTVKHDMHYSYMDLYDKMKEERKMIPLDYFFTSLNGSIKLMQRYIKLGFIISDFIANGTSFTTTEGFVINYSYDRMPSILYKSFRDYDRLYNAISYMKDDYKDDILLSKINIIYSTSFDVLIKPVKNESTVNGITLMKEFYEKLLPYLEKEMEK